MTLPSTPLPNPQTQPHAADHAPEHAAPATASTTAPSAAPHRDRSAAPQTGRQSPAPGRWRLFVAVGGGLLLATALGARVPNPIGLLRGEVAPLSQDLVGRFNGVPLRVPARYAVSDLRLDAPQRADEAPGERAITRLSVQLSRNLQPLGGRSRDAIRQDAAAGTGAEPATRQVAVTLRAWGSEPLVSRLEWAVGAWERLGDLRRQAEQADPATRFVPARIHGLEGWERDGPGTLGSTSIDEMYWSREDGVVIDCSKPARDLQHPAHACKGIFVHLRTRAIVAFYFNSDLLPRWRDMTLALDDLIDQWVQ